MRSKDPFQVEMRSLKLTTCLCLSSHHLQIRQSAFSTHHSKIFTDKEWKEFGKKLTDKVNILKNNTNGQIATYIPQLAKANPSLFSVSVCTVDGKEFQTGDSEVISLHNAKNKLGFFLFTIVY